MDILTNLLGGPFTDFCKWCINLVNRQIDYIVHYEDIMEQLNGKLKELEESRVDVLQRVETANNNLEVIKGVVETWLQKVEKEITTQSTLDGDQDQVTCFCWGPQYNLGKEAAKKMDVIDELLNDRRSFGDTVSHPRLIGTDLLPSDDLEPFESRENLKKEVMAALQDEGTNLIGVYGMGGVGKTTLVTQVYDQVKKEKNLFDEVVMITISQNVDLIKIQNEIAEMLGLTQMKTTNNAFGRAALLSERLKLKRTLVILDDMWSPLEFSDVGIPRGEKGCKVIITTRKLDVCTRLSSTKNINVAVLLEEESWNLFRKKVGDLADSTDLETTAKEIAEECGGLPVALVTLGKGLRNKSKPVWENTLRELRNSKTTYIEDMEPKVFKSIKLSFDYLEKDIFKKYFLLCCLFHENYRIRIKDLMEYVVSDDAMLEENETLKQRVDRVHSVLDKLVDSCLLLRTEGYGNSPLYTVKMHDVVRDVAIHIAYQEDYGFLVKACFGLKQWPDTGKKLLSSGGTGECLRLSLMLNEITVLPTKPPELPQLLSLSLLFNVSLKKIPDSFFQKMGSLETLDLRCTGISSLPSSLSFLVNLKTLDLQGCKFNQMTDISVIGMLKKLEILNLRDCGLRGLPEEIKELTNLKFLNLANIDRDYKKVDYTIPKNVISNLSRLEYLDMWGCEIEWEVEGWGNGKNASLEEVAFLPSLSGLVLHVSNQGNIKEFYILFTDSDYIMDLYDVGVCEVNVSPPVCHPIKVLIQRVEFLRLETCTGLKCVGQLLIGFNNLKKLYIRDCGELEYIMSFVAEAEIPRPFRCFENLQIMRVHHCNNLRHLFSTSMAMNLQNLAHLEISFCSSMVKLVTSEKQIVCDNVDDQLLQKICPNLKRLEIIYCENLKQLWDIGKNLGIDDGDGGAGDDVDDQLASILDFPYLEYLEVVWCENLKRIHLTHQCTHQLKEIVGESEEWFDKVLEWENPSDKSNMKPLFKVAPVVERFNEGKRRIGKGKNKLVEVEEEEETNEFGGNFASLNPSSTRTTQKKKKKFAQKIDLSMQSVKEERGGSGLPPLTIGRSPLVKGISTNTIQTTGAYSAREESLRTEILNEEEGGGTGGSRRGGGGGGEEEVKIISCDDMVSVFNLNLVKRVPYVKSLNVFDCRGLKDVFNLKEIGTSTPNIEEALSDFTFSRLREMTLHNLPILENIWKGYIPSVGFFENLISVEVCGCHKLSYLFSLSMARNLQNLKRLTISYCSSMVKLVTSDEQIVCDDKHDQLLVTIFPNLEWLAIEMCENLKQLWDGKSLGKEDDGDADEDDHLAMTGRASILDFPCLVYLKVCWCRNLKRILLTHQCTKRLKTIVGDSEEWFEGMGWENPNDKSNMQPHFRVKWQPLQYEVVQEKEGGGTGGSEGRGGGTGGVAGEGELKRIEKGKSMVVEEEETNEFGAYENVGTSNVWALDHGLLGIRNSEIGTAEARTSRIELRDDVCTRDSQSFTGGNDHFPAETTITKDTRYKKGFVLNLSYQRRRIRRRGRRTKKN